MGNEYYQRDILIYVYFVHQVAEQMRLWSCIFVFSTYDIFIGLSEQTCKLFGVRLLWC